MNRLAVILAFLLMSPAARGDERPSRASRVRPALSLPREVAGDVGKVVRIKARTEGKVVRWVPLDDGLELVPPDDVKDSRTALVIGTHPGEYRMLAYTSLGDVPSQPAVTVVVLHGAQPPPVPPVPPVPPEPPKPPVPPVPPVPDIVTSPTLWIVTVDEWAKRTPQTTQVLTNASMWSEFKSAGHSWRVFDASEKDIDGTTIPQKFAAQLALSGGMPIVVLMDPSGKWLNKRPDDLRLPATADGMRQLVRKYSGK